MATVSAPGNLKYSRQATFLKKANIAHGPQQVNNVAEPGGSTTTLMKTNEQKKPKQTI